MIGHAAFFAGAIATVALLPNALASSLRHLEAMRYQAAMQHAPQPSCFMEHGYDYPGHDVANVPGHYDECCDKCASAQVGCKAWTWTNFNGGTCWLKSGRSEIVVSQTAKSALYYSNIEGTCNNRVDLDFVGNDLFRLDGASAADCCVPCQNILACRAYTWSDYKGGSCWLKSKVTEIVFRAGVQSATVFPNDRAQCFLTSQDQDIEGNDIANRRSTTPKGCCEICQTVKGCRAYSWTDYQGGTCWLKSKYGVAVRKVGVVSAEVSRD